MKHNGATGFTLVELLVVVAVIGILMAVISPQFLKARDTAHQTAAEAYARNVYTSLTTYLVVEFGSDLDGMSNTEGSCELPTDYEVTAPARIESCTVTETTPGGSVQSVEVVVAGQHGSAPVGGIASGASTPTDP